MSATLVIAWREVVSRRAVFPAAAVAAGLSILAGRLPGLQGLDAGDVTVISAAFFALVLGGILALWLGASSIGAELASGRLSFYFSRPVAGLSIWAGKVGGTLAVVLGAVAVMLLPAWVARTSSPLPSGMTVGALALALIALVALGNALGVIFAARSPWLVLDAVALLTVAAAGASALADVRRALPLADLSTLAGLTVAAAAVALFVAGAIQVSLGRVEARRGHRLLSIWLWPLLLVVGLGGHGAAWWARGARPSDLSSGHWPSAVAPAGTWVALSGPTTGRLGAFPGFLIDTSSGAFVRLGPSWPAAEVVFSGDGTTAAWIQIEDMGADPIGVLRWVDLAVLEPRVVSSSVIVRTPFYCRLALSDDGSRVAMAQEGRLTVTSLPEERSLGSAPIPETLSGLAFTDGATVLLWHGDGWDGPPREAAPLTFAVWEEATGRVRTVASTNSPRPAGFGVRIAPDRSSVLVAAQEPRGGVKVIDLASGEIARTLDLGDPAFSRAAFLSDGHIAAGVPGAPASLLIVGPDGSQRRLALGIDAATVAVGHEARPGVLVVVVEGGGGDRQTLLVDVSGGHVRPVGADVRPLPVFVTGGSTPRPGSAAARLLLSPGDLLVLGEGGDLVPVIAR